MKYKIFQEVFQPRGVYPIATQRSELFTSDDPAAQRQAFSQYGTLWHSEGMNDGTRKRVYRRESSEYIHLTTILEQRP